MANPKNSAQAFNEAVRPFFEHKTAYTAEKGFTGETTEGGVPQSIERQKIMEGRQAIDTVLDVPMAAIGSACLLYTSPSPRDGLLSRMPSSA